LENSLRHSQRLQNYICVYYHHLWTEVFWYSQWWYFDNTKTLSCTYIRPEWISAIASLALHANRDKEKNY